MTAGWPVLSPETFRLQAFEKCFDSSVVKTVSFSSRRIRFSRRRRSFLRARSARCPDATIGVENAAGHRITQPHRHIQGTDGQISLLPGCWLTRTIIHYPFRQGGFSNTQIARNARARQSTAQHNPLPLPAWVAIRRSVLRCRLWPRASWFLRRPRPSRTSSPGPTRRRPERSHDSASRFP